MDSFNLFERGTPELIQQVRELGDESNENIGTLLLREGISSDHLFIVMNGALGVTTQTAQDAKEQLSTLGQGSLVGEMSWLEKRPPVASVEVHAPSTLLSIPHANLEKLLEQDCNFATQFYRLIAEKLALQIKEQNTWVHRFSQQAETSEPLRKVLILFAGLDERDVHRLAGLGRRRMLSRGDILLRENDPVTALYIILSGEVDVTVSIDGNDHVIGSSRRGEVLGEMTFLLPEQNLASATIQSRSGLDLLEIDASRFMQELRSDHKFASRFYRSLACMLSQRSRDQLLSRQLAERSRLAEREVDQLNLDQLEGATRAARHFDWLCRQVRSVQEFSQ